MVLLARVTQPAVAQFPPAAGTGPGLPKTIEAIDAARVTTRILYVTAHPDDESAAALTYLARGRHADVALLCITRGEGGQNALGPEQAPQLGLIRTQELLTATRGYGVKLFFTRAPDFGYSKTAEETMNVWGDQVLDDMVRIIRTFRPDIVINQWGGVHFGHGHHQATGILTPKAVEMAGDKSAFPQQLGDGLSTWGDAAHPVEILDLDRGDNPKGYVLPLDDVSSLWGKTWREMGLDAFVNHRTQGISAFITSAFLRRPIALVRADGGQLDPAILAEPLTGTNSRKGDASGEMDQALSAARDAALRLDWPSAVADLAEAGKKLDRASMLSIPFPIPASLYDTLGFLRSENEKVHRAIELAAGLEATAEADSSELVVGSSFHVSARARCRKEAGCALGALHLILPPGMTVTSQDGDAARGVQFTVAVQNPPPPLRVPDLLLPEPPPLVSAEQNVSVAGYAFQVRVPVMHIEASSARLDKRPLRMVPAYTLAVEPEQVIEVLAKERKPFDVLLRVHSYADSPGKVNVGLDVPERWTSSAPVPLEFAGAGDRYAKLSVAPPRQLAPGQYTISAYAQRGDEKFSTSLEPLSSLPPQLWSAPAECRVEAFDIQVPGNLRIGYITAEAEPIPAALERLGIRVEMLDAAALAFSDLSRYDAIVVGVRAYELRSDLSTANQRILDYVAAGGTLLVQYQRDFVWNRLKPGPYPSTIGSPTPRITDETAEVRFLKPDDPLLNRPNKITADDFRGWVQERGLYFWSQFDPRYTPLLAMHDPGENDLDGGLVYAHHGKGVYIYTGLAFFRQLPEGVAGAYRLFINLLAAGR
jgi:LmbE family N-acetylglucosaminyl deacetylase